MNIVNVNTFIDPVTGGGTAERTCQMSMYQHKQGHHVKIITTDVGIKAGLPTRLIPIEIMVLRCLEQRFYIPKLSFQSFHRLYTAVAESDILHLMGHWTVLNAIVYLLARRLEKPYVVCPAGALPIFGRNRVIKYLYSLFVGKSIIRRATRCIAVTELERDQFAEYGISQDCITVIPNGVDFHMIPPVEPQARERLCLPDRPFILFLGRLNLIKGPDLLMEAYASVTDFPFDLVFVGPDGGMLADLKKRCMALGVTERVHFPGAIRGVDKYHAYRLASSLIVPSRKEAMSIVAVEAGAVGTPVLLTDQCGFDEVAQSGGGFVVAASIEGLAGGLREIAKNVDSLSSMGEKLKKLTKEKYDWAVIVKRYDDLYKQLLLPN